MSQRSLNGVWKEGLDAALAGSEVMVWRANTHSMKAVVQDWSPDLA